MKKTIINLISVTLLTIYIFSCSYYYAQPIELDQSQTVQIPGRGFYPFSQTGSEELKELIQQNPNVHVQISNLNGSFLIAPAADGREIGKKQKVKQDGFYILNYRKGQGKNSLGLSFVPKKGSASADFDIQPFAGRSCPNPVNCQDDCGENLGKCCEKDSNGNQTKICKQVGLSSCGCANR